MMYERESISVQNPDEIRAVLEARLQGASAFVFCERTNEIAIEPLAEAQFDKKTLFLRAWDGCAEVSLENCGGAFHGSVVHETGDGEISGYFDSQNVCFGELDESSGEEYVIMRELRIRSYRVPRAAIAQGGVMEEGEHLYARQRNYLNYDVETGAACVAASRLLGFFREPINQPHQEHGDG
ncbi:MAG: hypothetical protein HYV27_08070 [Candidatus Hydrogenedentes bacterium]|nr:hypothetical protein [Candidatus Hydrogenedentota bacterium]